MKNRFTELYICTLALLIMGLFEIIWNNTIANTTEGFVSGISILLVGVGFLAFAIISHVKYKANRKKMDREMSKEYDERDDIIEGKASHFTMRILMMVTILMMFLSNWFAIPTNTALFLIIVLCASTNLLAKKYYNHVL